jgi:hypothetical protein
MAHRAIGQANESSWIRRLASGHDANRGVHLDPAEIVDYELVKCRGDALGNPGRLLRCDEHRELDAAQPADRTAVASALDEDPSEASKESIAAMRAIEVVEGAQAFELDVREAEGIRSYEDAR